MRKSIAMVLILATLVLFSACGRKTGEFTSSSAYVTPTMMQQLKENLKKLPEETEKTKSNEESTEIEVTAENEGDEEQETVEQTALADEKKENVKPTENNSGTAQKSQINTVGSETVVYVTKNGKKFHKVSTCSNMTSPQEMTRSEAEASGRTYCKKCYE